MRGISTPRAKIIVLSGLAFCLAGSAISGCSGGAGDDKPTNTASSKYIEGTAADKIAAQRGGHKRLPGGGAGAPQ